MHDDPAPLDLDLDLDLSGELSDAAISALAALLIDALERDESTTTDQEQVA